MGHAPRYREPAWTPPRERTAANGDGQRAPVTAPWPLAGQARGIAAAPLDHPIPRVLGSAAVLGMQRTNGNAHVARLLIQRLPFLTLPACQTAGEDAVIGTDEEKQRFDAIKKIMEASATGREALAVLDTHQVKIDFDAAGGSEYDPNTNTIVVDANEPDTRAALALVHELNHARYEKEGLAADVQTLSRADYIKQGVEEEAESVVKSIEAKIELEGTPIDVSQTSYPFEPEYRAAYKLATDAAKQNDPTTAEDALKTVGRAAGKARVIKGYMDGEIIGSRSGKTYPDQYGEFWDTQHQQPGGK